LVPQSESEVGEVVAGALKATLDRDDDSRRHVRIVGVEEKNERPNFRKVD
jgi:hypothetical protein